MECKNTIWRIWRTRHVLIHCSTCLSLWGTSRVYNHCIVLGCALGRCGRLADLGYFVVPRAVHRALRMSRLWFFVTTYRMTFSCPIQTALRIGAISPVAGVTAPLSPLQSYVRPWSFCRPSLVNPLGVCRFHSVEWKTKVEQMFQPRDME